MESRRDDIQTGHGRHAPRPSDIPALGWWDIGWRVWSEVGEDRVMLVAAGVTFYLLLALFPALAAFVSLYGFVADPDTVADHVSHLGGLLPSAGVDIIRTQLDDLASQDEQALGIGFLIGLAIALWSANNGVKALFEAMNIAHEEQEKRGFLMLNLTSIAFTMGALLIGIALILTVGAVPAMLAYLRLDAWAETLIAIGRWPVLLVAILTGISLIYRFGPSRRPPKWRWLSWGAAIATIVWVGASWGFSFYLQNFANYNATYGSLGAVIGLMMWTWISVIILIVGAEINAEMEHQTKCDSTVGEPKPMGERGAVVADTLGKTAEEI
ncbi:MAG TPA: YihY/virulence factor BrkB family protein [Pseudaminobacter sp.]|nr:YihY/virulence factor BrkB family protein [Pseudaminobacter sp.]